MTLHVIKDHTSEPTRPKRKITCTTCGLKGCVGRCQWKAAPVAVR
jgi:hypothetical protein